MHLKAHLLPFVLSIIVLGMWLVNWFMNFGTKIYIHYFFTVCFVHCSISKVVDTIKFITKVSIIIALQ